MAKKIPQPTNLSGERTFLVGVELANGDRLLSLEDSLAELALLAESAGLSVVGQITQMRMIFDGMRFALVVQVNGEITKTNAANVNGNAITLYDIEFSKFLDNTEKLKELNTRKPATMEETKALLKDVPGLVIETGKRVSVSFKGK